MLGTPFPAVQARAQAVALKEDCSFGMWQVNTAQEMQSAVGIGRGGWPIISLCGWVNWLNMGR
jgi:hypothetical protein